jgi:hypothetical protein
MNRRTWVHRVINDTSQKREALAPIEIQNTSRSGPEQFPVQKYKPLNGNGNDLSNILGEAFIRERVGSLSAKSERDCAEARTSEVAEYETYLTEVSSLASDETTINCLIGERSALSKIADSEHLPETMRAWAAQLRDRAGAL